MAIEMMRMYATAAFVLGFLGLFGSAGSEEDCVAAGTSVYGSCGSWDVYPNHYASDGSYAPCCAGSSRTVTAYMTTSQATNLVIAENLCVNTLACEWIQLPIGNTNQYFCCCGPLPTCGKKKSNAGAIAGAVIGVLLFIALVAGVIAYLWWKKLACFKRYRTSGFDSGSKDIQIPTSDPHFNTQTSTAPLRTAQSSGAGRFENVWEKHPDTMVSSTVASSAIHAAHTAPTSQYTTSSRDIQMASQPWSSDAANQQTAGYIYDSTHIGGNAPQTYSQQPHAAASILQPTAPTYDSARAYAAPAAINDPAAAAYYGTAVQPRAVVNSSGQRAMWSSSAAAAPNAPRAAAYAVSGDQMHGVHNSANLIADAGVPLPQTGTQQYGAAPTTGTMASIASAQQPASLNTMSDDSPMVRLLSKIASDLRAYGSAAPAAATPRRIAAVAQSKMQFSRQGTFVQQILDMSTSLVEAPDATNLNFSVFSADNMDGDAVNDEPHEGSAFINSVFDAKLTQATQVISQRMPVQPDVELNVDPFSIQFVREVGQGAFGKVYEGYWTARDGSRKRVAVKVMSALQAGDTRIIKSFQDEINIMTRISHPHIVRCYGGCVLSDCACVLLEYMAGGSLDGFIQSVHSGSRIPETDVWEVAAQVASALAFLHPIIVHCDIKPANILLDENGVVKVGDFGLSKMKMHTLVTSKAGFTPAYTAPETMEGKVSELSDIFSLGVVLWESWTGQVPWSKVANQMQIYYQMVMQKRYLDIPDDCPPALKQLISDCWQEAKQRPHASVIVQRSRAALVALKHASES